MDCGNMTHGQNQKKNQETTVADKYVKSELPPEDKLRETTRQQLKRPDVNGHTKDEKSKISTHEPTNTKDDEPTGW